MSTTTQLPAPSDLQNELSAVEQIALAATVPFIKSAAGQQKVQTIAGEVNLGIAALPVFISIFQTFTNLLSHIHTTATAPAKV